MPPHQTPVRLLPIALALGLAAAGAVASEPVASVSQLNGVVLVSQGADYVTATPGIQLREGDRLMAMEGASATLSFADGCTHTLSDNAILTVGPAGSCARGELAGNQAQVGPYLAAAAGGPATAGLIAAGVVGTTVLLGATDVIDRGSEDREDRLPPSP